MTPGKADLVIGICATDLTKYLMERDGLSMAGAYAKLFATETSRLLKNPDSRLYLEDDAFLRRCLESELTAGKEAMYEFLDRNNS